MSVKDRGRIQTRLKETEETGQRNAMCVCVCVCVCVRLMKKLLSNDSKKVSNCIFNVFISLWLFQTLKEKKNR